MKPSQALVSQFREPQVGRQRDIQSGLVNGVDTDEENDTINEEISDYNSYNRQMLNTVNGISGNYNAINTSNAKEYLNSQSNKDRLVRQPISNL